MRNVSIPILLVSLVAATHAQAQESLPDDQAGASSGIVDSAVRTALRMELQPTTQRVVAGGSRGMFWTGIAMMAGGGLLAGLSGNVLAEGGSDQGYCDSYGCSGPYYEFTDTNSGVLYGGIGVAATGAVLALMNRGRQRQAITTFLPTRGGAAVFRRLTF